MARLVKRGWDSGRSDDNEETIRHRLVVYNEQTSSVQDYYRRDRKVLSVDGLGGIEEITERIYAALEG